jgi:hypothetical protein
VLKKKELLKLPQRKWDEIKRYHSILLVPTGRKHDSGWMLIALVGMNNNDEPEEIAAFCDDVCWVNLPDKEWEIRTDCFYPSGIMRVWGNKGKFEVGLSLSSTSVTFRPE